MKFLYILLCSSIFGFAQSNPQAVPNTEVYLFDIKTENGKMTLSNPKNISDNKGYDNQPSFMEDYLLFSSNRNGQTDIVKYYLRYGSKTWVNFTPGSEYSPMKIPGENAVSAINLESDGSQKLYKYSLSTGQAQVLIEDIVIGYQLWYDSNTLISSVLENDMLNLYKTDMATGNDTKLAENIGRSLHKIPNTDRVSYISKTNGDNWEIRSIDITTVKSKSIVKALAGAEDMVWLKDGTILMGDDGKIFKNNGNQWTEWIDLKKFGIGKITRLAIDDEETKFAVVGESNGAIISSNEDSETSGSTSGNSTVTDSNSAAVVQSHIAPYNNGNLDGFLSPFSDDINLSNFPNEVILNGKEKMRESYVNYFKNNKNLSVSVNKRIVLNNYVIDEELSTVNNETNRQVTIYQIENDKIQSATFLQNNSITTNAEEIVNKQLKAYNERDIDGFMATYSSDIKLYNYPNELRTKGAEAVKKTYSEFFQRTPDLRGVVQNRIIIGNKVIDQEHVTINGEILNAVAIYEVENGKISRVTFIQ